MNCSIILGHSIGSAKMLLHRGNGQVPSSHLPWNDGSLEILGDERL